jgi:hypothetical protein
MSYRTDGMSRPPECRTAPITISAPAALAPLAPVHHMLRQANFTSPSQTEMFPGHVNVKVMPHAAMAVSVPRVCTEVYPTHNHARQLVAQQEESHWNKHDIVASVAGLETHLAKLDSEIRAAAPAHDVMGHLQDHASLLRHNAQLAAATHTRHRDTTALTHQICSRINDSVETQAGALRTTQSDVSRMRGKQDAALALTHDICAHLDGDLHEHRLGHAALRGNVALLQQKDKIAQTLLGSILAKLDQQESVVARLQQAKPADHEALLEAMCAAFEKTKGRMQSFEKTQAEMQRVVADFQGGRLAAAHAPDTHSFEKRLDKYQKLSRDMDAQFSHDLARQQGRIRELDAAHQAALQQQQGRIQELERAHQLSAHHQSGKIQELEAKVQQLSLQHLDSSQHASIARGTDREVKLLQHELRHVHALKKDVEAIQAVAENHALDTKRNISQMQQDLRLRERADADISRDVQHIKTQVHGAYSKTDMADMAAKMQDMRREMMLQEVRLDKNQVQLSDLRKKIEA